MTNKKMPGTLNSRRVFMGKQILAETAQIDPKTYNDNAVNRVPENEYKSTFEIAVVTCGFCICMSGLFTGAAMAAGFTFGQAIAASLLGNVILSAYSGAIGYAGAKEHVATSLLARHAFGRWGSIIISLVLALTMLGWYSVQVGFFGVTINAMFPGGGFITRVPVAAFWGGILMLITAYIGFKGLSLLSKIAVPLIVILAIVGIVSAVKTQSGWDSIFSLKPASPMPIGAGIVMVVGSFAAGGAAQPDITRYARTPAAALIGTIIGYMGSNVFIILAGFITSVATGSGDLPAAMLQLGMGIPSLVVLIAAQWTTNDNNLYTSSLGFSNIFKIKKSRIVLATGILASIVGAAGLSDFFVNWLIILGIGCPPMAGVIVADYFLIRKQRYDFGKGVKYCGWNILAFVSWAVACIVGYAVQWGVAAINSMTIGFVLYLLLMKTVGKNNTGMIGVYVEE
jgi:cytosine permease